MTIIPERDVYRLIMRSKLPAAERFEEWVVGEVLPEIRKTGSYGVSVQVPKSFSCYVSIDATLRAGARLVKPRSTTKWTGASEERIGNFELTSNGQFKRN